jgi:hypothetical protein
LYGILLIQLPVIAMIRFNGSYLHAGMVKIFYRTERWWNSTQREKRGMRKLQGITEAVTSLLTSSAPHHTCDVPISTYFAFDDE